MHTHGSPLPGGVPHAGQLGGAHDAWGVHAAQVRHGTRTIPYRQPFTDSPPCQIDVPFEYAHEHDHEHEHGHEYECEYEYEYRVSYWEGCVRSQVKSVIWVYLTGSGGNTHTDSPSCKIPIWCTVCIRQGGVAVQVIKTDFLFTDDAQKVQQAKMDMRREDMVSVQHLTVHTPAADSSLGPLQDIEIGQICPISISR
jgi:hypothetical protein